MDFIPAVGVVQANLHFISTGGDVQNVLHYEAPAAIDYDLMMELGAALVDWFDTDLKNSLVTSQALVAVVMTDLTTQNGPTATYTAGLPITGTGGSDPLPANCAITVTKRTAKRGRSYRGRIYSLGASLGNVNGDLIDNGFVAGLVARWSNAISLTTASGTWPMVVVSRYHNNAPRITAEITPVTSMDADNVVDSQRRRLVGRGA